MARLSAIGCLLGIATVCGAQAQDTAPDPGTVPEREASPERETAPAKPDLPVLGAELTRPPRIASEPSPGDARLEPAPEEREDMLEAVVTGGQTDFRLPDLGTSFRNDDDERDPNQRIEVSFLNLYDPDNRDPAEEAFPSLEERLGHGMLRVFRLRFGNPNRD